MVGTGAQCPGAAVGMGTLSPCSTGPFSQWFPEACVHTETPGAHRIGASLTGKHRAFPTVWCLLQCKFRKPWAQRCSRHKSSGQGLALSMRDSLKANPAGALAGPAPPSCTGLPFRPRPSCAPLSSECHCPPHQNLQPTDPFLSTALPFWLPACPVSTPHSPAASCCSSYFLSLDVASGLVLRVAPSLPLSLLGTQPHLDAGRPSGPSHVPQSFPSHCPWQRSPTLTSSPDLTVPGRMRWSLIFHYAASCLPPITSSALSLLEGQGS